MALNAEAHRWLVLAGELYTAVDRAAWCAGEWAYICLGDEAPPPVWYPPPLSSPSYASLPGGRAATELPPPLGLAAAIITNQIAPRGRDRE
jgi:hypothetical protein